MYRDSNQRWDTHLPTNAAIGTASDPWEYAFGDARRIESEVRFNAERDRFIHLMLAEVAADWEADFLYYPPGQASATLPLVQYRRHPTSLSNCD